MSVQDCQLIFSKFNTHDNVNNIIQPKYCTTKSLGVVKSNSGITIFDTDHID